MSELSVSKKIEELPPEAKKEAQDFVDFLYQRYVNSMQEKSSPSSISDSSFFGIWKNRDDMKDSTKWIKKVRQSQWSR